MTDPRSLAVNHSNFTSNGKPSQIKSIVGDVRLSILTEAQFSDQVGQGWVLADGQDVTGSPYATLTGNSTVPDMRGRFPRGLDTGAINDPDGSGRSVGDTQGYKTAAPSTSFSGTATSSGSHNHTVPSSYSSDSNHRHYQNPGNLAEGIENGGTVPAHNEPHTDNDGAHTHSVTVSSGGDSETRPLNFSVNYFIYVGF